MSGEEDPDRGAGTGGRDDGAESASELRTRLERTEQRLATLRERYELLRAVDRVAAEATDREALAAGVARRLVETGPYVFAWVGERDPATDEVVATASHGREDGYLDGIRIPLTDEDRRGPIVRAVETRELQVTDDIAADPVFEPWRDAALERGFRSSVAVPVVHGDTVYGVVAVYADRPDAFDESELELLADLGRTVGLATGAIERRRALVADAVLEVDVAVADHPLVDACAAADVTLSLAGVVAESDDEYVLYYDVDGDAAALVAAVEDRIPRVRQVRTVDPSMVEIVTGDSSVTGSLSARGGVVTDATVDADRIRATVEFPVGTDVRRAFEELPHEVTLLAQRTAERPIWSERRFGEQVTERLTDRQLAALRTAYFSGYHDRPRTSDGEAVAAALDVSPSTFHQHHRVGVRKLLAAAFDRPAEGADDIPD